MHFSFLLKLAIYPIIRVTAVHGGIKNSAAGKYLKLDIGSQHILHRRPQGSVSR